MKKTLPVLMILLLTSCNLFKDKVILVSSKKTIPLYCYNVSTSTSETTTKRRKTLQDNLMLVTNISDLQEAYVIEWNYTKQPYNGGWSQVVIPGLKVQPFINGKPAGYTTDEVYVRNEYMYDKKTSSLYFSKKGYKKYQNSLAGTTDRLIETATELKRIKEALGEE